MAYRLFEGIEVAKLYGKFRPSYTPALYDFILSYLREGNSSTSLLVDVGCGPGQSTLQLAKEFEQVVGTDISEAQIEVARQSNPPDNVKFVVCPAESIPLEDTSVDLITCGQSFHWFDADRFYAECKRLLKPGGCLALYGYDYNYFENKYCQDAFLDFQKETDGYFSDRRDLLDNRYRDVVMPFEDIRRDESMETAKATDVEDYISYLQSWSGYRTYCEKGSANGDILGTLQSRLMSALESSKSPKDTSITAYYPCFVVVGRKSS